MELTRTERYKREALHSPRNKIFGPLHRGGGKHSHEKPRDIARGFDVAADQSCDDGRSTDQNVFLTSPIREPFAGRAICFAVVIVPVTGLRIPA
jgi:hypothetical protein